MRYGDLKPGDILSYMAKEGVVDFTIISTEFIDDGIQCKYSCSERGVYRFIGTVTWVADYNIEPSYMCNNFNIMFERNE